MKRWLTSVLAALVFASGIAQAQFAIFWSGAGADLVLHNDFTQGTLTSQTGPAFSLTRATATTTIDSADLVQNVASGDPRWWRIGAGSGMVGLWSAPAHTNLVLQSEDFGTTWAVLAATTPTLSSGAHTCGVLSMDLIGDNSALLAEGYSQIPTFTGNAVKVVSLFVKKGTAASSVVRLRDNPAVTNRLLAAITWDGTTPVVTMTTGTHEGTDVLADGVHRIRLVTTSVTAANQNQLNIYPATDAALDVTATGDIYIGGVMAQNALESAPYIKTTTAAVTVNADELTANVTDTINAVEGTLYLRLFGPANVTGNHVLASIDDGTANEFMYLQQVSSATQVVMNDGGAAQATITRANLTAGASSKMAARYKLNDTNVAKDGAAGTADTACTVPTMTTVRIGYPAGGFQPNTVIEEVRLYRASTADAAMETLTAP